MGQNQDSKRNVLFQKLGNNWYAFTEGPEGTLYTMLPEGINPHKDKFELYEVVQNHLHQEAMTPTSPTKKKDVHSISKKRSPEGRVS